MKEDNATYTLHLYQQGRLVQIVDELSYREAFDLYHRHDPFDQTGVDVYRDGTRMTFGQAIKHFSDPHLFVVLY